MRSIAVSPSHSLLGADGIGFREVGGLFYCVAV